MASGGSSLSCEEQLLCSICLEVFREPVTTPCGHNYCKSCITDYWDSSSQTRCPLCKRRFRQRPALRCNTSFRDVLDHLRGLALLSPTEEQQPGPGDVPCDICLEPKHKALKTCVVCAASYCHLHLEPHQRVPNLKKHALTDPLPDLDHRVCWRHGQMLEFFCAADQTCVCYTCTEEDHAGHGCVALERAFAEERGCVARGIVQLSAAENAKTMDVDQISAHIEQSKKKKDADVAEVERVFGALVDSLNRDKLRLVQVIEQKYTDALREPEERVCQLQKSVVEIRQWRAELEESVQIDDPLRFLQSKPEVPCSPQHEDPFTQYDCSADEACGVVKSAVEQMKLILSEEMDKLIQTVQHPHSADGAEMALQLWIPLKDEIMTIQQNDAVDLTLDPYSAHAFLSVGKNGKGFSYIPFTRNQPQSWFYQRHFQNLPFVLSTDGFSSGRFYFEVEVGCATQWAVGVVRENFNRNMTCNWIPGPSNGAWILSTLDPPNARLQKVGVFVDYEKAEVLFYDIDARVLVSSFRACTFNEPVPLLKSAFNRLLGVTSTTKLYPVFGAFGLFDSLEITAVDRFAGGAVATDDARWALAPRYPGLNYCLQPFAQSFYQFLSPVYSSNVLSNTVLGPKTSFKKRKKKKSHSS